MPSALAPGEDRGAPHEREVAALLQGDRVRPSDPAAFLDYADRQGVVGLLAARQDHLVLPDAEVRQLRARQRELTVAAAYTEAELRRVIAAVGAAGEVLVVKGAHLAFTVYGDPAERTFRDVDVLIPERGRAGVGAALESLGYRGDPATAGEDLHGQVVFRKTPGLTVDVHLRLSRRLDVSRALPHDAMWARGEAFAGFPPARVPCRADALAIAAVHQAVHHEGDLALAWLWDVHLLLRRFTPADERAFHERVMPIREVVAGLLAASQQLFPTPAGERLVRCFAGAPAPLAVRRQYSNAAAAWMDVRHAGGVADRIVVLRRHLFPPAAFMRGTFRPASRLPLPALYALRILKGLAGRR